MKAVEFSTMLNVDPSSGGLGNDFFDAFTNRYNINVKRTHMEWGDSWNQLVQFGLNSHGPDLSEVGTTWLGSFQTMDAVRPITAGEASILGGENNFPSSIWNACKMDGADGMLGIPWTLDLRVVLYRTDWLKKAGADPATAFSDADHFVETLQRLRAAGYASPLGITTSQTHTRISHDMACWVWDAGGNIRSDDGRRMMLAEPQSLAGIEAYFGLHQFISPEMAALNESDVFQAFFEGKTAVAILPERAYLEVLTNNSGYVTPEVAVNTGVAMLMKAPYLGGSALTIWRHSPDHQDALRLIQYLNSMEAWEALYELYPRYTPARFDALAKSHLSQIPYYPIIVESMKNARSFHSGYRWRGVEARMVSVIEQMWNDLRVNSEMNIHSEVPRRFSDLCKRLEQTILAATW